MSKVNNKIISLINISEQPKNVLGNLIALENIEEAMPLANFLNYLRWDWLPYLVEAINQHKGFGMNEEGYRFLEEKDGEVNVKVYDFNDSIIISETAFLNLMNRLFQKVIEIAERDNASIKNESWWGDFVEKYKDQ